MEIGDAFVDLGKLGPGPLSEPTTAPGRAAPPLGLVVVAANLEEIGNLPEGEPETLAALITRSTVTVSAG